MYKIFDEINKVIGGFHSNLSVSILRCPLGVIIIMNDGNVGHNYHLLGFINFTVLS